MGNPLVTIITATYNSSKTLGLTLQSILLQEFQDFEVWVIGDACTDDSGQVVNSFGDSRLNWFNLPNNSGSQSEPNNEGIRRARAKYIAYLGHDDLWFPWHLQRLVDKIQQDDADFVHSLTAFLVPDGLSMLWGPPSYGRTYGNQYIPPSSWLHKKELVVRAGYWGEYLKTPWPVDKDIQRRMYLLSNKFTHVDELSVLKFPSPDWKLYQQTGAPPQANFLHSIKSDPTGLERQLLLKSAHILARKAQPKEPITRLIIKFLRFVWLSFGEWYGFERWPLNHFLVWLSFQLNQRRRKPRGLPAYKKS